MLTFAQESIPDFAPPHRPRSYRSLIFNIKSFCGKFALTTGIDGKPKARVSGGKLKELIPGACTILKLLFVFSVLVLLQSIYHESGFGYTLSQCVFKSVGSLDHYSKSGRKYDRVSDVLAAGTSRLGFMSSEFPTDKDSRHNYTAYYDVVLAPYAKIAKNVMEIGVKKGGSVQLWREYFSEDCFVYGIDIDPAVPTFVRDGHMKTLVMSSASKTEVDSALKGIEFDVIIDDGNHQKQFIWDTYTNLRPYLSDTGIYIVEDWNVGFTDYFRPLVEGDRLQMLPDSSEVESLLVIYPKNSLALRFPVA